MDSSGRGIGRPVGGRLGSSEDDMAGSPWITWLARASLLSVAGCAATPTGVDPGELAPDLALPDRDGVVHALADHRGEVVLLEFWAMWCPGCQGQAPVVQALHEEDPSFTVIGVLIQNEDGDPPTTADAGVWADAFGLTFPALADEQQVSKPDWQPLQGLPATWVIDPDGYVVWAHRYSADADELIEAIDDARR
jgi:peroxiredoxin